MKILCVHGIGKHDPLDRTWQAAWIQAISSALQSAGSTSVPEFTFCAHDPLFKQQRLTFAQTLEAIATLGGNALFGSSQRGLFDGDNVIGWTAGMVLQWAGNPDLRREARLMLKRQILNEQPDAIVAHSLGSLIAYDLFSSKDDHQLASGQTLLTLGSQINSRFVADIFDRGVVPLPPDARWFHLFNPNDHAFATEIVFQGAKNFRQVVTASFGNGWFDGHTDLQSYLNDPRVILNVWNPIVNAPVPDVQLPIKSTAKKGLEPESIAYEMDPAIAPAITPRPRRALLIGINQYANPDNQLEGCVNDVFQVSSVLQEGIFEADEIRVILDRRATAEEIRKRLAWLFEDLQPGDLRFLYFSGHGLQMPVTGPDGRPRLIEALVASDYDGTLRTCITDSDLSAYYAKLPHDRNVVIALDCCHAGGITRQGGPRIRGIDPPDDIRHRMLRWNEKEEMWEIRKIDPLIPVPDGRKGRNSKYLAWREECIGENGNSVRLGMAVDQRRLGTKDYDELRKRTGWRGAFMPMMLLACKENEKSSEYLHGASSYGAFTFAFCRTLQHARHSESPITFQEAITKTGTTLKNLGYLQTPYIIGPEPLKKLPVPIFHLPGSPQVQPQSQAAKSASRKKGSARRPAGRKKRK